MLEKKSKERSFAYFPLRPISIIHSSFPLGVLFLFPLVSDSVENASKQPLPRVPLATLALQITASPWHHLQAAVLRLQACEQAALGTQFAHSECSGILFIAGSFFWIAHFSSTAIIAFTDISGDVDYFAFVSHLYGKGLQVRSVLWPLTQLEMCQGHVHQKVKAWGQCDIASVLGVLDIHMGLRWGWNNVGKKSWIKKKNSPAIALKQGRGLKGSTVVWGPVQNSRKEGSVRFEGWKILHFQSQGSTQIPIAILAPLSRWPGWHAEMSLNYYLGPFFKLGTLSLFNFQKIAVRTLSFIYFVVEGTQGHDLANALLLSDWIIAQVQGRLMPKPGFSLCATQVLTCKANKSWHKGLLHFLSLLDVPLLVVLGVLQAASPWCLVVKTPLQQQWIVLSLVENWILHNR